MNQQEKTALEIAQFKGKSPISPHPPYKLTNKHFQHNRHMSGNHRVCEYLTDTLADRMFLFKRATTPDIDLVPNSIAENENDCDQLNVDS